VKIYKHKYNQATTLRQMRATSKQLNDDKMIN